ncbi:hypothetical protein VPFG_00085 [Vibrio phage nt-1]|uniref:Uncharacterized protein n=1 Tax=Vibrio phage nt-1 TaxID=115992 RepID=R9TJ16_9CAUD|nr:hypothetical protein VPFG_00085 [Vibrio phage nt-1]AGN30087.1 hypothetical protein VPFG_00085 [Vibrio phage nt-1]
MNDLTKFDIRFSEIKVVYSIGAEHQKVAMRIEDGTIMLHEVLFIDAKGSYCETRKLWSTKVEKKCAWPGYESAQLVDKIKAAGKVSLRHWRAASEADYELFRLTEAFEG